MPPRSIADLARSGQVRAVDAAVDRLHARHRTVAESIGGVRALRAALLQELDAAFLELRTLAHGVASLRELTPRTRDFLRDFLVVRGEQLSARIVVAGLTARGAKAQYLEAAELIVTDGVFGNAFPDLAATDRRVRERVRPLLRRRIIPVIPGFVGGGADGAVVTLGRGGSDLTATVLGRSLGAQRITLWKDVPGLMTTDPRLVPSARIVPQLNVREAAELAYYGAKVLHPRALIPLARVKVPAAHAAALSGQGAQHRARAGAGHGDRQRHAGRARYCGAHLRGVAAGGHLGDAHFAGVVGAFHLSVRARRARG